MKMECPSCGDAYTYRPELAGRVFECSYCKRSIKMPTVDELPAELKAEHLAKVAAERRAEQAKQHRAEAQVRKATERRQKRQSKLAAALEVRKLKHEAKAQRDAELAHLEDEIDKLRPSVPEEGTDPRRYIVLRTISSLFRALAALTAGIGATISVVWILLGIVSFVRGAESGHAQAGVAVFLVSLFPAFVNLVGSVFSAMLLWAAGEVIMVFIDMADDMRITRMFLKSLKYPQLLKGSAAVRN